MNTKKAFTLVEVLIVVSILGILAAVVIPEFNGHIQQAKESAAKETLRNMRTQIEHYYIEFGAAPGYVNNNPDSTTSSILFYVQLISNKYVRDEPVNPFNDLTTITICSNSTDMPESATGTTGWIYKPSSRTFKLNYTGTDSKGVKYYDY